MSTATLIDGSTVCSASVINTPRGHMTNKFHATGAAPGAAE